ncbi:hypothetical protein CC1G_06179 [Coprinopsis cinerea okayama7|uniref:Uncharacterized protein n=1 Tax=Coprinopsis cinerea (strain Okayama-7 / 130 / ATCC MYA-4618 / FGSC 9003) TaxID=240176 RepID=A8NV37_COPC7|nr:hypothetical protein CC1G_06179 [Coprinopsis cinerea okayama7\|eukprot:XP_001836592.2 hypothetical protein CC1G_06179 [Coprinopsis cinerea okayama7\
MMSPSMKSMSKAANPPALLPVSHVSVDDNEPSSSSSYASSGSEKYSTFGFSNTGNRFPSRSSSRLTDPTPPLSPTQPAPAKAVDGTVLIAEQNQAKPQMPSLLCVLSTSTESVDGPEDSGSSKQVVVNDPVSVTIRPDAIVPEITSILPYLDARFPHGIPVVLNALAKWRNDNEEQLTEHDRLVLKDIEESESLRVWREEYYESGLSGGRAFGSAVGEKNSELSTFGNPFTSPPVSPTHGYHPEEPLVVSDRLVSIVAAPQETRVNVPEGGHGNGNQATMLQVHIVDGFVEWNGGYAQLFSTAPSLACLAGGAVEDGEGIKSSATFDTSSCSEFETTNWAAITSPTASELEELLPSASSCNWFDDLKDMPAAEVAPGDWTNYDWLNTPFEPQVDNKSNVGFTGMINNPLSTPVLRPLEGLGIPSPLSLATPSDPPSAAMAEFTTSMNAASAASTTMTTTTSWPHPFPKPVIASDDFVWPSMFPAVGEWPTSEFSGQVSGDASADHSGTSVAYPLHGAEGAPSPELRPVGDSQELSPLFTPRLPGLSPISFEALCYYPLGQDNALVPVQFSEGEAPQPDLASQATTKHTNPHVATITATPPKNLQFTGNASDFGFESVSISAPVPASVPAAVSGITLQDAATVSRQVPAKLLVTSSRLVPVSVTPEQLETLSSTSAVPFDASHLSKSDPSVHHEDLDIIELRELPVQVDLKQSAAPGSGLSRKRSDGRSRGTVRPKVRTPRETTSDGVPSPFSPRSQGSNSSIREPRPKSRSKTDSRPKRWNEFRDRPDYTRSPADKKTLTSESYPLFMARLQLAAAEESNFNSSSDEDADGSPSFSPSALLMAPRRPRRQRRRIDINWEEEEVEPASPISSPCILLDGSYAYDSDTPTPTLVVPGVHKRVRQLRSAVDLPTSVSGPPQCSSTWPMRHGQSPQRVLDSSLDLKSGKAPLRSAHQYVPQVRSSLVPSQSPPLASDGFSALSNGVPFVSRRAEILRFAASLSDEIVEMLRNDNPGDVDIEPVSVDISPSFGASMTPSHSVGHLASVTSLGKGVPSSLSSELHSRASSMISSSTRTSVDGLAEQLQGLDGPKYNTLDSTYRYPKRQLHSIPEELVKSESLYQTPIFTEDLFTPSQLSTSSTLSTLSNLSSFDLHSLMVGTLPTAAHSSRRRKRQIVLSTLKLALHPLRSFASKVASLSFSRPPPLSSISSPAMVVHQDIPQDLNLTGQRRAANRYLGIRGRSPMSGTVRSFLF